MQTDKIPCPVCGKITEVDADDREVIYMPQGDEPVRDIFALLGLAAFAFLAALLLYQAALLAFHEPIYNDGFEAGRASAVRDCAGDGHINQCVMPEKVRA